MLKFKQLGVACAFAFGAVLSAQAGTDTTTFQVKIKITESCDIKSVTATDVDFGSVARGATPADADGKLVVNCSNNTPYTVGLNDGLNASAPGARNMKLGTGLVAYTLYKDSGRSDAWGQSGSALYSGTGTGVGKDIPVHGRVAAGATNVPAGDYVDTVTATLTY